MDFPVPTPGMVDVNGVALQFCSICFLLKAHPIKQAVYVIGGFSVCEENDHIDMASDMLLVSIKNMGGSVS